MNRCISGKRVYPTQETAEEALLAAWTRFDYAAGNGPVAVYQCEDCGNYHLTSRGPMNERLDRALREGTIQRQKEADRWAEKFRRK